MERWQRTPWKLVDEQPPPRGSRVVGCESIVHLPVLYDYQADGTWKSVCSAPRGVVSARPPLWMPIRDVP
jgi:hypothetical protein